LHKLQALALLFLALPSLHAPEDMYLPNAQGRHGLQSLESGFFVVPLQGACMYWPGVLQMGLHAEQKMGLKWSLPVSQDPDRKKPGEHVEVQGLHSLVSFLMMFPPGHIREMYCPAGQGAQGLQVMSWIL
jgi:hypothetical protein